MKITERIFKTSIIYFIGQVFAKLVSFILLPLYTNYVNVSDYGYYDLTVSLLGVAVPVLFLELWTGTLRFALEGKDDDERRKVINNAIIIIFACTILYSVCFFGTFLVIRFEYAAWVYLYSIMWVIQLMYLSIARAYSQNALYASSGVISVIANTIASIIVVFISNGHIASLYVGMCTAFICQAFIINRKVNVVKNFKISDYDKNLCVELVKFSFPLSLNSIINWLLEGCNKLIITGVLGSAANGIYAVGSRVSTILNLFVTVFLLSWQESLFRINESDDKDAIYNTCINTFLKTVGACLVLLLPFIKFIFPFMIGDEYKEVYGLIPLLLLSVYMNSLHGVIAPLFAAEKQTKYSMYNKIYMSLTNLIVMYFAINRIGIYASPIALILAYLVGIFVQLIYAKKFVAIKIEKKHILIFLIMYLAAMYLYYTKSMIVNAIWFIFAIGIYLFYLKDFIKGILDIAKSILFKK